MPSPLKVVSNNSDSQVPGDTPAAAIRDRLALERRRLDALEPRALDLAADVLATLHELLRGEVATLAADRTPRYRRGQLLGEAGLPVEDLCYLALRRPGEVATALHQLVDASEQRSVTTVGEAFAGIAEVGGQALAGLVRALEDGTLTLAEVASLQRALDQLELLVTDARGALREVVR